MAIEITFQDFDTVCYSNQHNIIQLIKNSVGLSVEVNINSANISQVQSTVDQVQSDVADAAEDAHDALLLGQNLNTRVSKVEAQSDHIWDCDDTFLKNSRLGQRLKNLEDAVFGE